MQDLLPYLVPSLLVGASLVRRAMDQRFYRKLVGVHGLKPEKLPEVMRAHREPLFRLPGTGRSIPP